MSRRRNDNKPTAQPRRIGKPRTTPKGGTYQVRAYAGTDSAPFGRVTFRHPDTGRPTSRVPSTGETPDELFERIERALDQQVAIGATAIEESGVVQVRNMEALGKLYIQELQDDGASEAYVIGRECLIRKWIDPVVGDLLVQDWAPQDSKKIIARMGTAGLSKGRIEDLGSTLSGMRQTAHAKRHGGRWLSLDEDPLERVKYTWKSDLQGADRSFVKPKHRPSTDKVQAAIESAYDLNVPHWMPTIISVAAFCALRLGEQLALRAIDIDFENHQLDVSGSWTVARKARTKGARRDRGRKANKNKMRRVAPIVGLRTSHCWCLPGRRWD